MNVYRLRATGYLYASFAGNEVIHFHVVVIVLVIVVVIFLVVVTASIVVVNIVMAVVIALNSSRQSASPQNLVEFPFRP